MVDDQRGNLQVLPKHVDRRALALGVSLSLWSIGCRTAPQQTASVEATGANTIAPTVPVTPLSVSDRGASSITSAPSPAVSVSTPTPALVMIHGEGRLTFYDSSAQPVSNVDLAAASPEFVACFGDNVVLQQGRRFGVMAGDPAHDVVWAALPAADSKCESPTWNIVLAQPAESGGLCFTMADGPPDTASCTQSYLLREAHGKWRSGCQIANFPTEPERQVSPSGRYSVTLGDSGSGDSDYFRRLVVADRQTKGILTLDQLMIERTQAEVQWLPNDAGAVVGGSFITLPGLKVGAQGQYGCVLTSSKNPR